MTTDGRVFEANRMEWGGFSTENRGKALKLCLMECQLLIKHVVI